MMTLENFDDIQLGAPIVNVTSTSGEPYSIRSKGSDTEEYEYVERIDYWDELISENHYFIIVRNGHVVGKRVERKNSPGYDLIYQQDPNHPFPAVYPSRP